MSFPTSGRSAADRAQCLDAILYLYRGGHGDPKEFWDELHCEEQDALGRATDEDMHLANACLEVEARLLRLEFAAAERLLASSMFGKEEADAKLDAALELGAVGLIARELIDLMDLGLD